MPDKPAPNRFFYRYPNLTDPIKFVEDAKFINWCVRWLIGYTDELEFKAKLKPDRLSARVKQRLDDVADVMCHRFVAEIGDYEHGLPSKPLGKPTFSPRKSGPDGASAPEDASFDREQRKIDEKTREIARKRRKSSKNVRKKRKKL